MSLLHAVIVVTGLVLLLWVAYKIGKVVLRVLAGLAFLVVVAYAIWYLFLRPHPLHKPIRSQHGSHFMSPVRS
jgi:uncharacterized membrane protein